MRRTPPIEDGKRAIDTMVGDSPYMDTTIQPWEVWDSWDLNPWEASAVKRIQRWRRPGGKGAEDLRKAIHELAYLLERAETNETHPTARG